MNVIYERCCGMDVHKDIIVACMLAGKKKESRRFSTMTSSLLGLIDWLKDVEKVNLIDSIPGVGERSAQVIIAEIGINMNQFPSAAHLRNTYFSAQYSRIAARRGKNRATVAVAHSILTIVYNMLKTNSPYQELGPDFFYQRRKTEIVKKSVKRLESLGYTVRIEQQFMVSTA